MRKTRDFCKLVIAVQKRLGNFFMALGTLTVCNKVPMLIALNNKFDT